MEFTLTWREILIAVVLASLFYLVEVTVFSRRSKGADRAAGEADLRQELANLRARVDQLEARLAPAESAPPEDDLAIYDHAVAYARQGHPAPEIAGRCGISIDEATLIVTLHAPRTAGKSR
ncbi:MAG: DUF2802 domain-containing protein [Pseudomonadota bacterium]